MELLESYLKAVKRYLPRGQQSDIIAELSEDIRSQMEEKEKELGRPLSEREQMAVFKEHGDPLVVAGRYRQDRRSLAVGWELISPELFPALVRHLCINVAITIAVVAIILRANRYPFTLQPYITAVLAQFVCVPLAYIALNFYRRKAPAWLFPPAALARLMPVPRSYSASGLIFCGLLTLWWLAVPHFPFLVFGPAAASLKLAPVWHRFYLPVLLLLLAAVAQRATNLVRPQWTWLLPVARLFTNGIGAAVAYLIFKGHTLVVAANSVQSVARYSDLAQAWNAWLLWGLFGPWLSIYLGITAIVYAWYCAPHLRQWVRKERTPGARAHQLNGIV